MILPSGGSMDQPSRMSIPRGSLLGAVTNSAFRWSPIGEVTESLCLGSRSMDEFYPELRVSLGVPSETFDCTGSPQSRSPSGRTSFPAIANGCSKQDKVKVYVRMRPFSESEKVCPLKQVLCLIGETIVVRDLDQKLTGNSKEPPHKAEAIEFKVDYMQDDSYLQVHSEIHKEESQKRMYGALGVPCIESALDGYNTTILAYGQTGSGKTYTMMGDSTTTGRGLIPRLANDLMAKIEEESNNGVLYTVQVSYLEIYQEKIRDLLAEDDVVEEEVKPPPVPQPSLDPGGVNSNLKVRISGNNLAEKVTSGYPGSLTENSYTSSFLNKAALQRQLEASLKQAKVLSEAGKFPLERSICSPYHDGGVNKAKSPKTKPAFDTVFSKQKVHKHYRTFPTVLEEAVPARKQNFLKIREHPITGPFVEGLLWKDVCNWYDMENLMKQGSTSRTTAATDMNEQSSRSHAVFSIRLTRKLGPDLFGVQPSFVSYINLVDLAGSEKLPKLCSGAVTGQRTQEESRCINRSLSQLNEVILSLSRSSFVSYRNSVLTWLLKESLGGNSRTFMVANISPTEKDLRESINTLRYATTASRIPPPANLDQDPRNKLIKKLKEEICTLRSLLSSFTSVKDNAPSGQLPSMQGFKVSCLDVGLQVEYNCTHDDVDLGKTSHKLLDKCSQTEKHFADFAQQTTSRSSGSVDTDFQILLKGRAALNIGNQPILKDCGELDTGRQTLTLNVCPCDSENQASPEDSGVMDVGHDVKTMRHLGAVAISQQSTLRECGAKDVCPCDSENQASPKDSGVMDVGHDVKTMRHLGAVAISQQSTLRECGARDVCLQSNLEDCGAVDVGEQTTSKGCGGVDGWNQIAFRNWSVLEARQQTASKNCGAVAAGNQVTLHDWGNVDAEPQTTLRDWGDLDAAKQITLRNLGETDARKRRKVYKWGDIEGGNQITVRDWGHVDVGSQMSPLCNWREVDAGNQITLQDRSDVDTGSQISMRLWGDVDAGNQITLRDGGDVDTGSQVSLRHWGDVDAENQTPLRGWGHVDAGNQITLRNWGDVDAGNQTTLREWGDIDAGSQISLRDWGHGDAGNQITLRNWGDVHAENQTTLREWGDVDAGSQISLRDWGDVDAGNQIMVRKWGDVDAGNQIKLPWDHVDAGNQIPLQNWRNVDAGKQITFRDWDDVDAGSQISLRDCGDVDVGRLTTTSRDCAAVDVENQIRLRDWGAIDGAHQTHPHILGVNAAGHQTRSEDNGKNEALDHTTVHADESHQMDWRDFWASDASCQVTLQKCGAFDVGCQVGWVNFGANERGAVVDGGFLVHGRDLKLLDFGQQASFTEICPMDINHKVNLNHYSEGMDSRRQLQWKHIDGPINVKYQTDSKAVKGTDFMSQTNLWQNDMPHTGLQTNLRTLGPVGTDSQRNWNDVETVGSHQITDGGLENEHKDLGMIDTGKKTMCNYGWGVDTGHLTDGIVLLTSDIGRQTSGTEIVESDAGRLVIFRKCTSDTVQQIKLTDCGAADLDFPIQWNQSHLGAVTDGRQVNVPGCWAVDVGKKSATIDQPLSLCRSKGHESGSSIISEGIEASDIQNEVDPRHIGAMEVGHETTLRDFGTVEIGYEAPAEVTSTTKEREEHLNSKDVNAVHVGHQSTLMDYAGISVGQQATLKGLGTADIGHQTSLKPCGAKERESQVEQKYFVVEMGQQTTLQDCGAVDLEYQTDLKGLEAADVGLQTSGESLGSNATENRLGWRDYADVDFGCQTVFEEYQSVPKSHQNTSTDFEAFAAGDEEFGLNKYSSLEAWKNFQCGVCGATPGNSMVVVSTMVPIQGVEADAALQTNWTDFCAGASECQIPKGDMRTSSVIAPITPEVLCTFDEGIQVNLKELHPFRKQHQVCPEPFGDHDCGHQTASNTSKTADLRQGRPSNLGVLVGPCNHWEEDKICIPGCRSCEQDYVVEKWQHRGHQEAGQDCVAHNRQHQACQEVGREFLNHDWQQHQGCHEIMLSEPSYLVTENDAGTANTDDESIWSAAWGSNQNPQIRHDRSGIQDFWQDVMLKQLRASNAERLQCTQFQKVDIGIQTFPADIAKADAEQQTTWRWEGINLAHCKMNGSFELASDKAQILKTGDEQAVGASTRTQSVQVEKSGTCDFSQQTNMQSFRCSVQSQELETREGYEEKSGHPLDGRLKRDQDRDCLSWLSDFTQGKEGFPNVPAEEAFHLCSLWTLAKLRSRMEWHSSIHPRKNYLKYKFCLATKCRGLTSQSTIKAEVATQKDSCCEDFQEYRINLSNLFLHLCSLWVFVVLRIAATDQETLKKREPRHVRRLPYLVAPGKMKILNYLSHATAGENYFMLSNGCRAPKSKQLRYSGVEPVSTAPFFIETSGDCSLARTRLDRSPQSGNAAGDPGYKIMCELQSHSVVHFLKDGVNCLGSNKDAHIHVKGLSEDHTEFVYMPAHRCLQRKGYVVARLVAPGAIAFLNGLPMLDHKELCTGDILVLRDLRCQSSVCTLHFFDLVKFS